MLHRRAIERGHRLREHGLARVPIVPEHTDLDELVRQQRDVDLVEHWSGQAVMADGNHRFEVMCLGTEVAAGGRGERFHGAAVYAPRPAGYGVAVQGGKAHMIVAFGPYPSRIQPAASICARTVELIM